MRVTLALICLALIGQIVSGQKESRIIGGTEATPGQIPWQACILSNNILDVQICGGVLITETALLTSAYCIQNSVGFQIILGAVDRTNKDEPGRVERTEQAAIVHPDYNPRTGESDIAIIRLSQPVNSSFYVEPITIANYVLNTNQTAYTSGWGRRLSGDPDNSKLLTFTSITPLENEVCELVYNNLPDTVVCGQENLQMQGPCLADAGGPLFTSEGDVYNLHGIVAHVEPYYGCDFGYPSTYTRVLDYVSWIRLHVPDLP